MTSWLEQEDWKTCCRGKNCPQINITRNTEGTFIIRIKDDYGDSVKMTKTQFDDLVSMIPRLYNCCSKK